MSEDEFFKRIKVQKSNSLASYFGNLVSDIKVVILSSSEFGSSFKHVNCRNDKEREKFIQEALHSVRTLKYPAEIFGYCVWPDKYLDAFHEAIRQAWGKNNRKLHPGSIALFNEEGVEFSLSELRMLAQAESFGSDVSKACVFAKIVDRFKPFYRFERYLAIANKTNTLLPMTKGEGDATLGREIFLNHLANKDEKIVNRFRQIVKEDQGPNGDYHRELLKSLDEQRKDMQRKDSIFSKLGSLVNKRTSGKKTEVLVLTEEEQVIQRQIDDTIAFFKKPKKSESRAKVNNSRRQKVKNRQTQPAKKAEADVKRKKDFLQTPRETVKKSKKKRKRGKKVSSSDNVDFAKIYPDLKPKENESLFTAVPVDLPSDEEIYTEEMALVKTSSESHLMVGVSKKEKEPKKHKKWFNIKKLVFEKPIKRFHDLKKGVSLLNPESAGYHTILERLYDASHQLQKRQEFHAEVVRTRQKMLSDSSAIHTDYQFFLSLFQQLMFRCQTWLNDPANFDEEKQRLLVESHRRVFSHLHLFPAHQQFAMEIQRSNERYFAISHMIERKRNLDPRQVNAIFYEEKNFDQGLGVRVQSEVPLFKQDLTEKLSQLKVQILLLREAFPGLEGIEE